ncbi:MAG: class I SAM-dependent methyltransferase [Candidatus Thorarchaeota archaeon]
MSSIKFIIKKLRYKYLGHLILKYKPIVQRYVPALNSIYTRIKLSYYSGKNLYCPCCENFFRKFYPHGHAFRSTAKCPNCGSLERHRLLLLYLYNKTLFFSEKIRVLHFTPSYALERRFKKMANLDYITTALNNPRAMIRMDITNIKFPDENFDVILCYHILEHVKNDQRAMQELYRILKPNGWAIIQVPIDFNLKNTFEDPMIISAKDREYYYGHRNHLRRYGRDYIEKLERVGFAVKVDDFIYKINKGSKKKLALSEDEKIIICFK